MAAAGRRRRQGGPVDAQQEKCICAPPREPARAAGRRPATPRRSARHHRPAADHHITRAAFVDRVDHPLLGLETARHRAERHSRCGDSRPRWPRTACAPGSSRRSSARLVPLVPGLTSAVKPSHLGKGICPAAGTGQWFSRHRWSASAWSAGRRGGDQREGLPAAHFGRKHQQHDVVRPSAVAGRKRPSTTMAQIRAATKHPEAALEGAATARALIWTMESACRSPPAPAPWTAPAAAPRQAVKARQPRTGRQDSDHDGWRHQGIHAVGSAGTTRKAGCASAIRSVIIDGVPPRAWRHRGPTGRARPAVRPAREPSPATAAISTNRASGDCVLRPSATPPATMPRRRRSPPASGCKFIAIGEQPFRGRGLPPPSAGARRPGPSAKTPSAMRRCRPRPSKPQRCEAPQQEQHRHHLKPHGQRQRRGKGRKRAHAGRPDPAG